MKDAITTIAIWTVGMMVFICPVIILDYGLEFITCKNAAAVMGTNYTFEYLAGGCFVKNNGRMVPLKSFRSTDSD